MKPLEINIPVIEKIAGVDCFWMIAPEEQQPRMGGDGVCATGILVIGQPLANMVYFVNDAPRFFSGMYKGFYPKRGVIGRVKDAFEANAQSWRGIGLLDRTIKLGLAQEALVVVDGTTKARAKRGFMSLAPSVDGLLRHFTSVGLYPEARAILMGEDGSDSDRVVVISTGSIHSSSTVSSGASWDEAFEVCHAVLYSLVDLVKRYERVFKTVDGSALSMASIPVNRCALIKFGSSDEGIAYSISPLTQEIARHTDDLYSSLVVKVYSGRMTTAPYTDRGITCFNLFGGFPRSGVVGEPKELKDMKKDIDIKDDRQTLVFCPPWDGNGLLFSTTPSLPSLQIYDPRSSVARYMVMRKTKRIWPGFEECGVFASSSSKSWNESFIKLEAIAASFIMWRYFTLLDSDLIREGDITVEDEDAQEKNLATFR